MRIWRGEGGEGSVAIPSMDWESEMGIRRYIMIIVGGHVLENATWLLQML